MKTLRTGLLLCALCAAQAFAAGPDVESIRFGSHGVALAGSIVLPAEQPAQAAVVFIHGSGRQSRGLAVAKRFAQDGIAALVYDKRGAGE